MGKWSCWVLERLKYATFARPLKTTNTLDILKDKCLLVLAIITVIYPPASVTCFHMSTICICIVVHTVILWFARAIFINILYSIEKNPLLEVTVNSKEENSQDFCPNYVQEFGLRLTNLHIPFKTFRSCATLCRTGYLLADCPTLYMQWWQNVETGKTGFHTKIQNCEKQKKYCDKNHWVFSTFSICKSRQIFRRSKKYTLTNKAGSQRDSSDAHGSRTFQEAKCIVSLVFMYLPLAYRKKHAGRKDTV